MNGGRGRRCDDDHDVRADRVLYELRALLGKIRMDFDVVYFRPPKDRLVAQNFC